MDKIIYAICFMLTMISCVSKEKLLKRDIVKVSKMLKKMKLSDQNVRHNNGYIKYYFGVNKLSYSLDSLSWNNDENKITEVMSDLSIIQDKPIKNLDKRSHYEKVIKNNQITTNYIDSINTLNLISITKKYGFPSHQRLADLLNTNDKDLTSSPHMIFVHSEEIFFPKIKKIVIEEYKKGRMGKNECSHIFWHLNGRNGTPFLPDHSHCKVKR
ncbi:hypothetical protein [Tenacibaculum xiamenense]|uniref:hypothetical protein n=1 Tax=Tenacibaculum xiamenense TaxID=1261553 RepID=UPI0038942BD5